MGMCARDIAIARLIRVNLLDDGLWDSSSSGRERPVTDADARSAAAPRALWYDFYFVRHGILSSFVVCICSGHLAVGWGIVYALHPGDRDRRGRFVPAGMAF